jgi:purine-cytosine permease-like protein
MMLLWFTMLMSPGYLSLGMLGPIFGLSVSKSIGLTVVATATGSMVPAFTATLCPALGLRQIAASRFAFGIFGSKICGFLNICVNVGFGTINCIVAGQLLRAVSDDTISDVAGIIIVLVASYAISFFGFRIIHLYESVGWILIFVLLCCEYGLASRYFSPTPGKSYLTGLDDTGSALSYFAIIFGAAAAWCSMSGDYYIHYPTNTNKWMLFSLTWIGLTFPTIFVTILGNLLGGIVNSNEAMAEVYDHGGFGALIVRTMHPSGFAKFVGVMYTLSFSTFGPSHTHSSICCLRSNAC